MARSLSYDSRLKPRAQELRRNMTRQERHLWYDYLSTCPVRFRRQKQFGYYIVDFYCAKLDLVVEIDGSKHYTLEEKRRDEIRTAYLNSLGLTVVRFSNYDIDCHFEGVCAQIYNMIEAGADNGEQQGRGTTSFDLMPDGIKPPSPSGGSSARKTVQWTVFSENGPAGPRNGGNAKR